MRVWAAVVCGVWATGCAWAEWLGRAAVQKGVAGTFVNLERSVRRRRLMERQFDTTTLTRFVAFDRDDPAAILRRMYLPPKEPFIKACTFRFATNGAAECLEAYAEYVGASTGEVALSLSHVAVLQESLDMQRGVTAVLEDDAAPLLYPFWTASLEEIAQDSWRNGWDYLRLFYCSFTGVGPQTYKQWQRNPHEQYQPEDIMFQLTGTLAAMFTPVGMDRVTRRTSDGSSGLLKCLPRGQTRCVSDHMVPYLTRGLRSKAHFPPLLAVRHFEDATGVRDAKDTEAAGRHERSNAQAMMSAVMFYNFLIAEEFFGPEVGSTIADLELIPWTADSRKARKIGHFG